MGGFILTKPITYTRPVSGQQGTFPLWDEKTPTSLFERLIGTIDLGGCLKVDYDIDPSIEIISGDFYYARIDHLPPKYDIAKFTLTKDHATVHIGGSAEPIPEMKLSFSLDFTAVWDKREFRIDGNVTWPGGSNEIHRIFQAVS